jgi:interferon alpha
MALILLEQIRRIYPFSWMKDRKDIVLPREEFDGKEVQKAQAISLLLEMTQQIYSLFSTKESSGA